MTDLRVERQRRCAATPEGHRFDGGTCKRCGLTVQPAQPRLRLIVTTEPRG